MGKTLTELYQSRMAARAGATSPSETAATEQESLAAQRLDCGCPAWERWDIGGIAVPEHDCCRCRGLRYVRTPVSVLAPGNPGEQITQCRCVVGQPEPNWADQAQIPQGYRSARLDSWTPGEDEEALVMAQCYVEVWPPVKPLWVLASHQVGNGKTTLAAAVMYEVWGRHHVRGQFWTVPDLARAMRQAEFAGAEVLRWMVDGLRRYPLLVLDDLGAQKDTEYITEQLFSLINYRYSNLCPTVITTNVPPSKLDERVASRLQDHRLSAVTMLVGPDRRRVA